MFSSAYPLLKFTFRQLHVFASSARNARLFAQAFEHGAKELSVLRMSEKARDLFPFDPARFGVVSVRGRQHRLFGLEEKHVYGLQLRRVLVAVRANLVAAVASALAFVFELRHARL